ncbi:uncharacterized protein [Rutidosis leptorrhynchoides]|uniref:uncharacterized protein n=1 Tax=Rutidosis leptorrhynchoides TaxID=125765 RepID=UPI003A99C86F
MEWLNLLLKQSTASGNFKGVEVGDANIKLSRLLCLKINCTKSSIYGVNVDSSEIERIAGENGCVAAAFPFNYLGIPIGLNMSQIANWNEWVARFKKRLANWEIMLISSGGRLTLIKSVLRSVGIYFLSLFMCPEKVINNVEKLRSSFFWGSNGADRKIH